jgi:diguanylate cyclase (GGDEF)-like protein
MQNILAIIANILIFTGACFLGVSLFPIRRLVLQLPAGGGLRRKWNILSALILFFISGYIGYIVLYWDRPSEDLNLLVPLVFFFGGIFVLLIGTLSLQTAMDIKQISVLKYETVTDPLMGIYNRRYFDLKLAEEIERAQRYNVHLSMLLLDIDHFKNTNDTYGHYIGDLVLKNLGHLLLKNVRKTDIVARYGGEEIAVIAPHTSVLTAADFAERLRQLVETSIMVPADEQEDRQAVSISVNIGVAELDQQVIDRQSIIKRTDESLYEAKQKGRNRVVVYNSREDSF